jgi:hypoxanthine-guanine phosphoribosyltransferase
MSLRLSEVIIAEKRIEPQIQEIASKVTILKNEASRIKVLGVLRQDKVDVLLLLM